LISNAFVFILGDSHPLTMTVTLDAQIFLLSERFINKEHAPKPVT